MNSPRHAAGGFARSAGGATARGLIVVLAALAVGLFLLARAVDDPLTVTADASEDGGTTDTTTATTSGTTGDGTSATTAAPGTETTAESLPPETDPETGDTVAPPTSDAATSRPPSQQLVQVANASRVSGAAGQATLQLQTLGYAVGTPTNYTGDDVLERSRIHYKLGFLLEAQNLATTLGLDPSADVLDMPAELPIEKADEDPDLLLLLGTDLATPSE